MPGNPNAYDNLGRKAGPGRPPGLPNKLTRVGRAFALSIVETEAYKASLMRRIQNDTLAPAVEVQLLNYAYGKPKDVVEMRTVASGKGTEEQVDASESEALAARARALAEEALVLKAEEERLETEQHINSFPPVTDSVQ